MSVATPNNSLRSNASRFDVASRSPDASRSLHFADRVQAVRDRLEARADPLRSDQLRSHVREGRGLVRNWSPDRAVSSDTASRYAKTVEVMRINGERPEDAKSKASFEFRRAALVHETRASIKASLRDLDRHKRSGDLTRAAKAYAQLRDGLNVLRKYPPSTGNRELDLQRRSAYSGPPRPVESNCKRLSIAGLLEGWKDDIQRSANTADRPALAAMSLTGARPAEIRGIKVRQSDDSVTFEIRGAKVDEDRGIKARAIAFSKDELSQSEAGRDLVAWLGNRDVRTITHGGDAAAFGERIARAADRAGYDDISSYSFRHAKARELKESGMEREEIAQRLGHRSDRSQSVYG